MSDWGILIVLALVQFTLSMTVSVEETHSIVLRVSNEHDPEVVRTFLDHVSRKYGFEVVRNVASIDDRLYHFEGTLHPTYRQRRWVVEEELSQLPHVSWIQADTELKRFKRSSSPIVSFNDPAYTSMWYIKDRQHQHMKLDINITDVWALGWTGRGVVVTILDDGIEHNHTDLLANYDPLASWDINDNDPDPFPNHDPAKDNKHGTRCAGEVAAEANNSFCGIGVAFGARIGGVRMLDGRVTDRVEAEALSLNPQHIDIYSASWGPNDDGKTVEKPGFLTATAFESGVNKGRGSLGSVFIWASGNGGKHGDDCNCDGYANSIFTVTVSSFTDSGSVPWYSESCAATLVSTPSSGAYGQQKIITTDIFNRCTQGHTGTSASAPLLAGVVALALEANARLSWRDVQHMLVWSANPRPLLRTGEWRTNRAGLAFNKNFGFGVVDTYSILSLVVHPEWTSVGTHSNTCDTPPVNSFSEFLYPNKIVTVELVAELCRNSVLFLEYVQLTVTVEMDVRGHLMIDLVSPSGTVSSILSTRPEDTSSEGFINWSFTTAHMWGENPSGRWKVLYKDVSSRSRYTDSPRSIHIHSPTISGRVLSTQLRFHGTNEETFYQKKFRESRRTTASISSIKNNPLLKVQRRDESFGDKRRRRPIFAELPLEMKLLRSFPSNRPRPVWPRTDAEDFSELERSLNDLYLSTVL